MEMINKYPLWMRLLALMGIAAGFTVLYLFKPGLYPYPRCVFHDLTGLYCPGCGSTRALYQILHGHFLAALHDNAMAVLAIPFFAYAGLRKEPLSRMHPYWVWGIFYLIVGFTILRNIHVYPFSLLAPLD
jgi:hypothetical protein